MSIQKEYKTRRNLATSKRTDKANKKYIESSEARIKDYELKAKNARSEGEKKDYTSLAAGARKTLAAYKKKIKGIDKKHDIEGVKNRAREKLKVIRKR